MGNNKIDQRKYRTDHREKIVDFSGLEQRFPNNCLRIFESKTIRQSRC